MTDDSKKVILVHPINHDFQKGNKVVDLTARANGWPDVNGVVEEVDGSNVKVKYTSGTSRWKMHINLKKKWPPIDPGTKVKTTQPNLEKRKEWTEEGWASKKWGVEGEVLTHHDSHGLCYDVKHSDGTTGAYDPSELQVL